MTSKPGCGGGLAVFSRLLHMHYIIQTWSNGTSMRLVQGAIDTLVPHSCLNQVWGVDKLTLVLVCRRLLFIYLFCFSGSMREIDVIDVSKQEDYKMLMREWTEYYNSPNRDKIFNVISLEFSNTKWVIH